MPKKLLSKDQRGKMDESINEWINEKIKKRKARKIEREKYEKENKTDS